MNKEEIIEMAKQAGFEEHQQNLIHALNPLPNW